MCLKRFVNRISRRHRLRFGSVYARIVEALPADEHPETVQTRRTATVGSPDCAS